MKKIILLCLIAIISISAQEYLQKYYPEKDKNVLEKLEEWQNIKFGLLMHWGPYSQRGIVESWSICAEDEGWCVRNIEDYELYKKNYEELPKSFNPVKFNPEKWAKAAKNAGMKYVIFTTKHHDGFCMFDTKTTDYKITSSQVPFSNNSKANITKEIFDVFRKEGLWTGAYFSKPDWNSNYYWWKNFATPDRNANYDIKKYPDRWQKFVDFTHTQIMELMSDYGKVDILWLDGGWVKIRTEENIKEIINRPDYNFKRVQSQDIKMDELVKKAREKQPGLIVVDRAVEGPHQNYLTPENVVPEKTLPYPWESCIIMGGGWSYEFNAKYRSVTNLVHLLVDIVAKGGNLLLNIAPSPEGLWDEDAYNRLEGIGEWMKINGDAIYNTKPIEPYKYHNLCFTQKGSKIYAIYLIDEKTNSIPDEIQIPETLTAKKIKSIKSIANNENLKYALKNQHINVVFDKNVKQLKHAIVLEINIE